MPTTDTKQDQLNKLVTLQLDTIRQRLGESGSEASTTLPEADMNTILEHAHKLFSSLRKQNETLEAFRQRVTRTVSWIFKHNTPYQPKKKTRQTKQEDLRMRAREAMRRVMLAEAANARTEAANVQAAIAARMQEVLRRATQAETASAQAVAAAPPALPMYPSAFLPPAAPNLPYPPTAWLAPQGSPYAPHLSVPPMAYGYQPGVTGLPQLVTAGHPPFAAAGYPFALVPGQQPLPVYPQLVMTGHPPFVPAAAVSSEPAIPAASNTPGTLFASPAVGGTRVAGRKRASDDTAAAASALSAMRAKPD